MRFCIETGRFAKKKEIAKQIPLNEVDNIFLEEKELNVDWKDSTQRFVFENANQAKTMFETVQDYLNQNKTKTSETTKAPEPSSQLPEVSIPEAEPPQEPKATSQAPKNKPRSKRRPLSREKPIVEAPKPPAQTTEDIIIKPEITAQQTEVTTPKAETLVQPKVPAPTKVQAPQMEPSVTEIIIPPPAPPKKEQDATSVLTLVYPFVDRLFDILRSLQGKVDWNSMENSAEKIKGESREIEKALACAKINTSPLAEATKQWNAGGASKEAYNIILSLTEAFSQLTSTNTDPPQNRQQYETAKAILNSYYVLNDIFLAVVVGDPTAEKETAQFATMLDGLVKATNFKLDTKAVVDALSKVQTEIGSLQSIEECRTLFKNQIESLLGAVKSTQ